MSKNNRERPYSEPEERRRQALNGNSQHPYGSQHDLSAMRKRKAKRRRKRLMILSVVVLICVVACVTTYHILENMVQGNAKPLTSNVSSTVEELKESEINFLCVGFSSESPYDAERDIGLTDVIMYVTVDLKNNKINMLQIPRDTYVGTEVDTGGTCKINAVAYHGTTDPPIAALAALINEQFKLPVDYYIQINTEALREIVDSLGGLEVNVPFDVTDVYGNTIYAGTNTLDGTTVEFLVRQRYAYSNGDLGRMEMQRYFYSALLKRIRGLSTTELLGLLPVWTKYAKTDVPISKLMALITKVRAMSSSDILMFKVPCEGADWNGQSGTSIHLEATAAILNKYFRLYSSSVPASELGLIELVNTSTYIDDGTGQSMDSIDNGTAQWGVTNVTSESTSASS